MQSNLIASRTQPKRIGRNDVLAFRTNGKSIEVVAQGNSAKVLRNVLAFCLIAVTVKAVLS